MLLHIQTFLLICIYLPSIALHYIVVWIDRTIGISLPFPRNIADLSKKQEWCIGELKKCGLIPANARVLAYKVTPLNQEIIFRSNAGVVEINFELNGEPKTVKCFAKFAPVSGTIWNRTIFNIQLNHIKETLFNRHFVMAGDAIPAPKVYYSETSFITGNLCLITELMDNCIEYQECAYESFPQHHLDLMLQGMASLHARYWNDQSPRMKNVLPIGDSTVHLFDTIVAFSWNKSARKILVKSWCRMNEHQTVLHGDSRIGNMMFPKSETEGRFVFIDWQAVRKGKAAFDLAYFLILSLKEEHSRQVEQRSIDTYYTHLVNNGISDYSKQEFEEDYRHACLCVLVLLSLPLLSGEASVEGQGALIFVFGMNVWRERLQSKFSNFDYQWLAKNYGLTETEGRNAIAEMLKVIELRLEKVVRENTK